jgi:hypothetical protein
MCKAIACRLADHVGLCCTAALTRSTFSGVRTESAGPTNLFTTLPRTLESSTHFKMALRKGILYNKLSFKISSHSKNAMIHCPVLHDY